ncbi:MAG: GNAT family protein [Candidatus Paceibacterota bacterium]
MPKIIIRKPKIEDLDSMCEMINSLVDEKTMISVQEKQTKSSERKFLKNLLKQIDLKENITNIIDLDGKVVGICSIYPCSFLQKHIGEVGIFLKKEVRGMGLGKKIFLQTIEEGKKAFKLKIIKLLVFSKNKIAIRMYKSIGFKKLGIIKGGAMYYGNFEDDMIMLKYL